MVEILQVAPTRPAFASSDPFWRPRGVGKTPRNWQREAFEEIIRHTNQGKKKVLVEAIMGAGKSFLLTELVWAATEGLGEGEIVVVTTSTVKLVAELESKIKAYATDEDEVGSFYTHGKLVGRLCTVACNDSVEKLREEILAKGLRVRVHIADEAHRGNGDTPTAEAMRQLDADVVVSLTATPFDARGQPLEDAGELIYQYGVRRALADGVIVPWRAIPHVGPECEVDEAMLNMVSQASGPGLVNAIDIQDAEAFAELLTANGHPARAIHSRLGKGKSDQIIADLKSGSLKCIVHVAMLTEGVDLPWLAWLGLRRMTTSHVRFFQEVGRVLRTHPGKERAIIYDPLDLFGVFKLTGFGSTPAPETIEEHLDEFEEALEAKEKAEKEEELSEDGVKSYLMVAKVLSRIEAALRRTVIALDAHGLIERTVASGEWRELDITDNQQGTIGAALWVAKDPRLVEIVGRRVLGVVQHASTALLNRGSASDLISLMWVMRDALKSREAAERMREALELHTGS